MGRFIHLNTSGTADTDGRIVNPSTSSGYEDRSKDRADRAGEAHANKGGINHTHFDDSLTVMMTAFNISPHCQQVTHKRVVKSLGPMAIFPCKRDVSTLFGNQKVVSDSQVRSLLEIYRYFNLKVHSGTE